MGRTATACLVLIAVGGCVSDDQGPSAGLQTGPRGQPTSVASCYAAWAKADQFAALQEGVGPGAPSPARVNNGVVQAPPVAHKISGVPTSADFVAQAVGSAPAPAPASTPNAVVDPQLVAATMVEAPGDRADLDSPPPPPVHSLAPAPLKEIPAASHSNPANLEVDQPGAATVAPANSVPASAGTPTLRMVNSKRITLNYELKDLGGAGVSGVELWCTQEGRNWKKGEIVAETNHSFTVEVKDEGVYGFTLLARTGAGAVKDAPVAGEQPQVWVMVDCTKPVVQITGVEIGHSGRAASVQIHWFAKDKNLGPRPITITYAEQPEGPWSVIASGIENNGQFEWQPPATAPHHVYLRVEAADLPGNVGVAQTTNPLRLDVGFAQAPAEVMKRPLPPLPTLDAPPSAAILGVEPNGN